MHIPRITILPVFALAVSACASDAPTEVRSSSLANGAAGLASPNAAQRYTAVVNWHAQQMTPFGNHRSGPVDGASAQLVRNSNGISFHISTNSLTPGNAYTLWLVVVNNPAACSAHPCTAADITRNPATHAQVRYAAGTVAGESGRATLSGAIQEGPLSGWLPDRALEDARHGEIHLVVNDHGPMIPEYMPGMIQTYRGGCRDGSPFPPPFPATALADGEPGPNTCLLYQAAVFPTP
jgi:hypothetical protein